MILRRFFNSAFADQLAVAWSWLVTERILLFGAGVALGLVLVTGIQAWWWRKRHTRMFASLLAAADEQRRAERDLRQTEMSYHSLVETIPQMILCKDLAGRFTFANQKFCAELGRSRDEILGKTDLDFFPRELAEKYRRDDHKVLESGELLERGRRARDAQRRKALCPGHEDAALRAEGEPIGIQGIFWDVTRRMQAEEQLKKQNVMLQELARSEHEAHGASRRPRAAWSRPRSSPAWDSLWPGSRMRSTTRWRS